MASTMPASNNHRPRMAPHEAAVSRAAEINGPYGETSASSVEACAVPCNGSIMACCVERALEVWPCHFSIYVVKPRSAPCDRRRAGAVAAKRADGGVAEMSTKLARARECGIDAPIDCGA